LDDPRVRAQLGDAPKANKYHNEPIIVDGIRFDSKREARLYQSLEIQRKAGVLWFLRQVPFHLPGGVVYRADFVTFKWVSYLGERVELHVLDAKGVKTKEYALKKRLVEATYPVTIEEV
jgi:hypothetical protein